MRRRLRQRGQIAVGGAGPLRSLALAAALAVILAVAAVPMSIAALAAEPPREGWQEIASGHGVRAEASSREDGIWLRVIASASYPLEQVCRVLSAVERYDEWYPGLVGASALEQYEGGGLIYGRFEPPWPFKDRDYVAEQRWRWAGNTLELQNRGAEKEDLPPKEGVVRLRNLFMRWRLTDLGERTGLEFVYREPSDSFYRPILVRLLAGFARDLISNLDRLGPTIVADASTPPCAAPRPEPVARGSAPRGRSAPASCTRSGTCVTRGSDRP